MTNPFPGHSYKSLVFSRLRLKLHSLCKNDRQNSTDCGRNARPSSIKRNAITDVMIDAITTNLNIAFTQSMRYVQILILFSLHSRLDTEGLYTVNCEPIYQKQFSVRKKQTGSRIILVTCLLLYILFR